MSHSIILEKFQGPLDLLLQLIEGDELNITDIALSQVTEQYFKYLDTLEEERSEELADFLVIATKLVYLKSRTLLPYLYPPDPDEGPSLAEQLKLYKRYAEASQKVAGLWLQNRVSYGRIEPPMPKRDFVLPGNAQIADLQSSMALLLKRLKPVNPLPQVSIDRSISVKQKIESIYASLQQYRELSFKEILGAAGSKTEVIVSFLALLELVKQERASIHQEEAFRDMIIKKI